MTFYPNAMNKARVRVTSVKVKSSATDAQAHSIAYNANRYASEMNPLVEVERGDGALVFIYGPNPQEETLAALLNMAIRQMPEWARERDDSAPIITDRVH